MLKTLNYFAFCLVVCLLFSGCTSTLNSSNNDDTVSKTIITSVSDTSSNLHMTDEPSISSSKKDESTAKSDDGLKSTTANTTGTYSKKDDAGNEATSVSKEQAKPSKKPSKKPSQSSSKNTTTSSTVVSKQEIPKLEETISSKPETTPDISSKPADNSSKTDEIVSSENSYGIVLPDDEW